ncbi:Neprilysin-2 [Pseudolycoriella hygida]|uniref:Neprilysin-2 n=1 Tax=Pseudolycoriella hygida TaxID=35572 RepID=A0A9Q0NBS8_9DIPT|nr:Neprilysin-2 [Pseudolycoriella hygida]
MPIGYREANGEGSCWSHRTTPEKFLIIFGTLTSVIVVIVLVVERENSCNDYGLKEPCLTKQCIVEASDVLKRMNQAVNPCDDFYEFACGTYLKETVIPDDEISVSAFSSIENKLNEKLRVIAEEPIQDGEIEPFKNVKRLYKACMNTSLIEELGVTPVRNIVDRMGGWPVLETAWNSNGNWTWQRSVQLSRENGYSVNSFMYFAVLPDDKNSSKRVITIDQARLGLSREFLIQNLTEPFVQAYHDYQVDLAVLFGANRIRAEVEMMEALNFEIKLAQISLAKKDRRDLDKLYNPISVRDLQANSSFAYAGHNWLSYFNNILPPESQLTDDTVVVVGAISFFQELGNLLKNTDNRIMANYAAWRHVLSSVDSLPNNFRARQLEYDRLTSGRSSAKPRWLECVEATVNFYEIAFGALYVRTHFNKAAKETVLEVVKNIKNEFKIMLKEVNWMDERTMREANEKVASIREEIGFANELLDDRILSDYYAAVPAAVDENKYYESRRILSVASALRTNRRLYEDVNKTEWSSHVPPAIVNAFYSSENKISFPAGVLQGVFFHYGRPKYMNYGGIGFVIGHEITHGFDDKGSQFDCNGNLKNWWAEATRKAYLNKAQCIINQYGDYVEPLTNLTVNGVNTQGENIADNGGIKEAYRAYQRWAANNPEPKLPGLDYTPKQMFWISAAQVWCSVRRKEMLKTQVTTGVHSPARFRVNGPMSNTKEFANDFNCASGTPMNPKKKCAV